MRRCACGGSRVVCRTCPPLAPADWADAHRLPQLLSPPCPSAGCPTSKSGQSSERVADCRCHQGPGEVDIDSIKPCRHRQRHMHDAASQDGPPRCVAHAARAARPSVSCSPLPLSLSASSHCYQREWKRHSRPLHMATSMPATCAAASRRGVGVDAARRRRAVINHARPHQLAAAHVHHRRHKGQGGGRLDRRRQGSHCSGAAQREAAERGAAVRHVGWRAGGQASA